MRPQSWRELPEVIVTVGLSAVFLATFLYALGSSAIPDILAEAEQRGHSSDWLSLSLLLFVLGLWTAGWYFAGPLAISAARLQWLVWRRDPTRWLRHETARALVAAAVLATIIAVVAGLALAEAGSPHNIAAFVVWVVLELLVVITIFLQRRDLDGIARLIPVVLGVAGVVLITGEAWTGLVAVIVGTGLMIGLIATRPRRLQLSGSQGELAPRWQLERAARNRWSVGAGVALMDGEIVRIVRQRDAKVTKRLLPAFVYLRPWPINLSLAVLARGLHSIALSVALGLPLAFAALEILGPLPAVLVIVLLEFFMTVAMSRSVQTWVTSNALPRIWAAEGSQVVIALAMPCLAVCLATAVIATIGLSLPLSVGLVLVVLPAAIMWRRHSAHDGGRDFALVSTPIGAVSVQAVNRVIAGPDMVLIALLLLDWRM